MCTFGMTRGRHQQGQTARQQIVEFSDEFQFPCAGVLDNVQIDGD